MFLGASASLFLERFIAEIALVCRNIKKACNYQGEISVANVTFPEMEIISKLPPGNYKSSMRYYDEIDSNIVNVTFTSIVTK